MHSEGGKIVFTKPVPMNAFWTVPPPPPTRTIDPLLPFLQVIASQGSTPEDPQLSATSSGLEDAYT